MDNGLVNVEAMGTGAPLTAGLLLFVFLGITGRSVKVEKGLRSQKKEITALGTCGAVLAIVNFLILIVRYPGQELVSLTVVLSMLCTVILAKSIGCIMPILAKVLRLDPAIMAAPLITTVVDACRLLIYFSVACSLLHIG